MLAGSYASTCSATFVTNARSRRCWPRSRCCSPPSPSPRRRRSRRSRLDLRWSRAHRAWQPWRCPFAQQGDGGIHVARRSPRGAFLHSIMPAWVASRSSLTMLAVMVAVDIAGFLSDVDVRDAGTAAPKLDLGGGATRRRRRRSRPSRPRQLGLLGGELLRRDHLARIGDGVGDRLEEQRARADRIVVARHDVIGVIGVGVGIRQTDDRDLEAAGFPSRRGPRR